MSSLVRARLDGSYKVAPVFDPDRGTPVVPPNVSSDSERERVMTAVRPPTIGVHARGVATCRAVHGTTRSICARNSRLRVRLALRFRPSSAGTHSPNHPRSCRGLESATLTLHQLNSCCRRNRCSGTDVH
jgi:hypothetical protein